MTGPERAVLAMIEHERERRAKYRQRAANALAESSEAGAQFIERAWQLAYALMIESALVEVARAAREPDAPPLVAIITALKERCVTTLATNQMNGEGVIAAAYRDAFAFLISACDKWRDALSKSAVEA